MRASWESLAPLPVESDDYDEWLPEEAIEEAIEEGTEEWRREEAYLRAEVEEDYFGGVEP